MTLAEYLNLPGHTASALAARTGSAVSTITRAAKGGLLPSRELMQAIFEQTGGLVTPNDFFGIKPADTASIELPDGFLSSSREAA